MYEIVAHYNTTYYETIKKIPHSMLYCYPSWTFTDVYEYRPEVEKLWFPSKEEKDERPAAESSKIKQPRRNEKWFVKVHVRASKSAPVFEPCLVINQVSKYTWLVQVRQKQFVANRRQMKWASEEAFKAYGSEEVPQVSEEFDRRTVSDKGRRNPRRSVRID